VGHQGDYAIDKTGTLKNRWELRQDQQEREMQARLLERSELVNINDEVLAVHGDRMRGKQEGVI
jgi:hypothetical protein